MPGDLVSERFNGGADGVAITTSNSSISAVVAGTPAFENTDRTPIEGTAWMKTIQTTLTNVRWDFTHTGNVLYVNCLVFSSDNPSAAGHAIINCNNNTTIRAQIRKNTDGGFLLYNAGVNVATGAAITAGTDCRLEWELNWAGGTQTLDIFKGANVLGGTADETISGALTNATRNRIVMGSVAAASSTAGSYHLWDFVDVSSTGFEPPPAGASAPPYLRRRHRGLALRPNRR